MNLKSFFLFFNQLFQFSDRTAKRFYHKLLSLPLLPASEIRLAFEKLKLQIEAYQELKGFEGAFDQFLRYFSHQWISGVRHVNELFICLPLEM